MRALTALAIGFALAACGPPATREAPQAAGPAATEIAEGSLEWAAAGPWRLEPERDVARKPVETLRFFGVEPAMTVVEVFPGRGWYSAVLAPYLSQGGGRLIAATFEPGEDAARAQVIEGYKARFLADPKTFGEVQLTTLSPTSGPLAPEGSADMVLVFRNVHTLMAEGYTEKAFRDFFRVLKPGGVLGIEQHRARSTGLQDPQAKDGYVQEAYVRVLAAEAGFEFEEASEINANPKDTKDHPFGVWTLPPVLRTAPIGEAPNPRFDTAPFIAIGESDRMTLRFRKPATAPAAPPPATVAP